MARTQTVLLGAVAVLAGALLGACCCRVEVRRCPPPCCPAMTQPDAVMAQPESLMAQPEWIEVQRNAVEIQAAEVQAAPPKGTGFMQGYDQMTQDPEDPSTWGWQKPGVDLRTYDHLMIDPIIVVPTPGSETEKLSEDLRKLATDAFRKMLVERIEPYYYSVEEPAAHVLRLRLAITDLVPVPEMEAGKPAVGAGGAAIEAEMMDAVTGEVYVRVIDRISGSTRGTQAEKKWRAVEGAFLEWADRLLDFMDQNTAAK